jgi:putative membrane protein
MGTVGYMSPEQVRGLPVDHRSDIFSFGAILYELLWGSKAFKKETASDTIAAILKEEPQELTQSGRNVSPALDHIVRHCLEKDRENRFQTAKDVAFALSEASSPTTGATSGSYVMPPPQRRGPGKAVWAIAAFTAVFAIAALLLWRRPAPAPTAAAPAKPGVHRVAVLPFENLGAAEDDYFADGIADAIRGKLTSLPGLEVIARGSSTPYKKTTKSPQEIARELYVSNVPFFDPLSFTFVAYASFGLARLFLGVSDHPLPAGTGSRLRLAGLTGLLMMWLDLVIDPLAVRGDRWFLGRIFYYPAPGWYFGVPVANFAGWVAVGAAIAWGWSFIAPCVGGEPHHWGRRWPGHGGQAVAIYYLVLAFNIAVTAAVAEPALLWAGVLLHVPLAGVVVCSLRSREQTGRMPARAGETV